MVTKWLFQLVLPVLAFAMFLLAGSATVALAWGVPPPPPSFVTAWTEIHSSDHTRFPCFEGTWPCNGQVAQAGSVVHDLATITSSVTGSTPTGKVTFARFVGDLHCTTKPFSLESVAVSGSGRVATAESSNIGPLVPGDYSYKAVYFPDAAAKKLGFKTKPANCEQLRVAEPLKPTAKTVIHYADHKPLACYDVGCIGQVAPAGSVVHDLATIYSGDPTKTPTGVFTFAWFTGDMECTTTPVSLESVAVSGSGGVATAESSNTVPLPAGSYSYKAVYFPDAAAKALGLGRTPAECEQLGIQATDEEEESS